MRALIVFILIVLATIAFVSGASSSNPQIRQTESVSELYKQSKAALKEKNYAEAARLYELIAARRKNDSGVRYDAACWWAKTGNKDKAFELLMQSIQSGYHQAIHLQGDSDLASLHDDSRWGKAVAACERQETKYRKDHSDPNKARFVTSDIALFWKAYDHAIAAATKDRAAIFQSEYLDVGTTGLADLNMYGRIEAEELAKNIDSHANYYRAIREVTLDIDKQKAETISAFRKLKQMYPPAYFPDTYFVIGNFGGGGTASGDGLLIDAEMFALAPAVPTTELDAWEKSHILSPTEIPPVVAHEFVHFLQASSSQPSLLCKSLGEGSADFISKLAVGRLLSSNQRAHDWANAREPELWDEFQKEMNGTDFSHWLYAGSGKGDRPADLGYWMGYKISEAYYKNAVDKKQAIKDVLMMSDCSEFLKTSRYPEKFSR